MQNLEIGTWLKRWCRPLNYREQVMIIGTLVLALIWTLSRDGAAQAGLAETLSFAIGLSSLILAIVAIFQALLAGNSTEQAVQRINGSIQTLHASAERIERVSTGLSGQVETLHPVLVDIPERVSNKMQSLFQEPAITAKVQRMTPQQMGETDVEKAAQLKDIISLSSNAGVVGLYMCLLAGEKKKLFLPSRVLSDPVIGHHVQGYISGIRASGLVRFEKLTQQDGSMGYLVQDSGLLTKEALEKALDESSSELIIKAKQEVERFFNDES